MAKDKIVYVCTECGSDYVKQYGKCPSCGAWNSMVEQRVAKEVSHSIAKANNSLGTNTPMRVDTIQPQAETRIDTLCEELNRVLGGGLVTGSLTLIGGEPGIGKSTLALQTALKLKGRRILYVSGEENVNQIKMRADRLGTMQSECYLLSETHLEEILEQAKALNPQLLVIDSIQTIASSAVETGAIAGSVSQIRECTAQLLAYAKSSGVPVILVGHITKEGSLAGPKQLEHIVDTVLQFEGDRQHLYRILRANKNRFGSTNELGIFEMNADGLREVSNPSEMLLSQHDEGLSGIAIASTVEGARPLLVEVQALVSTAAYGTPQRSSTGFDTHRMNMILAVLEKRVGFKLAQKDVFLNIAGGIRVSDPAIDLAVAMAILSSNLDMPIAAQTSMAGEIGLSGELRAVGRIEQRISEAARLGFKRIIVPASNNVPTNLKKLGIEIISAGKIEEVIRILMH
ncbi:MAG: DNA repair protein RadA [Paludibacteraceae bacterium]|nr:DNA repair protein RadA [Paludibacteraceae bacterium]